MDNYDIPQFPIKRLRYFNGQFLNQQDFIDDQAAHLAHERAQLRALCVAGICEGMTVTYTTGTAPPSISAGVAIDSSGRMIVIKDPITGPTPAGLSGEFLLHVRFNEVTSDPAGAQGTPGDRRFLQQPVISATLKTQTLPDGAVVLGTFQAAANAFSSHSDAGRQFSGVRLPGPLPPSGTPVFATLRSDGVVRGDNTSDGALLSGTLAIRRDVVGAIGPSLTLTNGRAHPGALDAGAAIDFNAYDPGSAAPAARIQSRGDANSSSDLVFYTKAPGQIGNALAERMRITSVGAVNMLGPASVGGALAVTGALSAGGAATLSSTLGVSGLITATGGLTAAANTHVSVSGTGTFKHGDRILHIGAASFRSDSSGFGVLAQAGFVTCTGAVIVYANIPLPAGKRIKTITVNYQVSGAGSVHPKLRRMDPTTGTVTDIWVGTNDNTGTAFEQQTNSPSHTMLATDVYWVEALLTNPANKLWGVVIIFDEP